MEKSEYIHLFEKYLANKASKKEIQLLIKWLKQENGFPQWTESLWTETSSQMDSGLQKQLLQDVKSRLGIKEQKQSRFLFKYAGRVAAVFLLLISSALSIHFYQESNYLPENITTMVEKGQKAMVTLPDGSTVWINSDSRLIYGSRFNKKERALSLEGEAFFEVVSDQKRPFIVKTEQMDLKVLGTSFNMKAYEEDTEASIVLMTGKVEVTVGNRNILLSPNERIVYNKITGEVKAHHVENASDYSIWKDKQLKFQAETFENIAKILERQYNTQIIFDTESLKSYRFTGTPGNTSLESILQILSLTSPLTYEVQDSLIILRENKEKLLNYEQILK